MKRSDYNKKRSFALRFFGVFMTLVSAALMWIGPYTAIHEKRHATAFVWGKVLSVKGEQIRIHYTLPGEDEGWLVTKRGEGWEKGETVRVFYNPDNLEEKYIEGFEESPWGYIGLGLCGLALGIGALAVSGASGKNPVVDETLDALEGISR